MIPLNVFSGVIETLVPITETLAIPSPTGRFTSAKVAGATVGVDEGFGVALDVGDGVTTGV